MGRGQPAPLQRPGLAGVAKGRHRQGPPVQHAFRKGKKARQGTHLRTCTKKIQLAETQLHGVLSNVEVRDILSDV